jgi:hypothetical protein
MNFVLKTTMGKKMDPSTYIDFFLAVILILISDYFLNTACYVGKYLPS